MTCEYVHRLIVATVMARIAREFGINPAKRFAFVLPQTDGSALLYSHRNAKV